MKPSGGVAVRPVAKIEESSTRGAEVDDALLEHALN